MLQHRAEQNCTPTIGACIMALLLSATVAPSLNMVRIATLPDICSCSFACGPCRHNGRVAIFGNSREPFGQESLVVYEHQGGNAFQRYVYPDGGKVMDFGFSPDSLGELVSMMGSWDICVLKSPSRDSFPSVNVWEEPVNNAHYGYGRFADLDRDGLHEIVFNKFGDGIWLFENTRGNEFESAAVLADNPPLGSYGSFGFADFDRDSLMELACGRTDSHDSGVVYVYEALGPDNQYALSAVCSTASFNNRTMGAAHDMDQNGRPEFLVWGQLSTSNLDSGRLAVYEASGHASYHTVWERHLRYSWFPCDYCIAVGDVDGDKAEEFCFTNGYEIQVFKCVGPANYERVWDYSIPAHFVNLFDMNGDGRCELICDEGFGGPDTALVFEDTDGLALDEFARLPKPTVAMLPATVVRAGTFVSLPSFDKGAELAIYDIRGRVITKHTAKGVEAWRWNLTDQQGRRVPAGTYFVLIRCQGQTASTKLCVVN